jgi:hypothetical protein
LLTPVQQSPRVKVSGAAVRFSLSSPPTDLRLPAISIMSSLKQLKLAGKTAAEQKRVILELNHLIDDIARCEKTINELQQELAAVNTKYPAQRTTRQDIDFLTDLLKCANKKLVWEKHIASLQKRIPPLLESMSRVMTDPVNPPAEETKAEMLRVLQGVQSAMEKLQKLTTL